MFDLFYTGNKPNLFAFEKPATSLEDAAAQSRTGLFWFVHGDNDYTNFDFNYKPVPWEIEHIHVWPSQWQRNGEVYLANKDTVQLKQFNFKTDSHVERKPTLDNWFIPDNIDKDSVEYSWHPDPLDPPYIYEFSTQWYSEGGPVYTVPGATLYKYLNSPMAKLSPSKDNWEIKYDIDEFDWSWRPHPKETPYNYVFGNQWYPAEIMPTLIYKVPGATEVKYIDEPVAKLVERHTNHWHTLVDCDWDYSWVPDPGDPPYIYVFGNQWHRAEIMPTVEYHAEGATERKFMDYPVARLLADKTHWSIPEEVKEDNIDFSWVPDPGSPPYVYHFGTEYQDSVNLTYTVPGATELRFEGDIPKIQKEKTVLGSVDIFFVDRGNATAQARYESLLERYPNVHKIRYANSMMDTIKRCVTRTKTHKFWVVSSEYSYADFNFLWHGQPWQSYMTHVFPSQHQKYSDTFLINKYEFERHAKWAKGIEEFPNLNFVKDQRVVKPENLYDVYYVDHGNPESEPQYKVLKAEFPDLVKTRFMDNYLDVFKRIMATATTEYVWITNSVCNYDFFDFTWQPEPWQSEMIHCFANGSVAGKNGAELRGDTFYIHVESFKSQMVELAMLDWFNVINYVVDQRVERWSVPAVYYDDDNLIEAIKNHTFTTPYAMFTKDTSLESISLNTTCLWTEKDRAVRPLSADKSTSLIPRDIKKHLKTQVYDYPYIDTNYKRNIRFTEDLDIIYISNGEPDEQKWYDNTVYQSNRAVKWIRGVDGRTAAYQAAARASNTDWFFAVFAKLEVLGNRFDWHWQPDYWQGPKHYIFNAKNPLNGLEYGHQGMIAYNKRLVLENNDPGIDFTLSQPHESVPILSGTAHFNQTPWMTWRTAFREVLKLKHFSVTQPSVETEYRLKVWTTNASGDNAGWCLQGAKDALEYYDSVNGNYSDLLKSFEWAWLKEYYDAKY